MRRLVTTVLLAGVVAVVAAPAASAAPPRCDMFNEPYRSYCFAVAHRDICEIPGMC